MILENIYGFPIQGNLKKVINYENIREIFLSREESHPMNTDLNMNEHLIQNVGDPINSDHGANKKYVDNKLDTKLDKIILKDINLNNKQLTNLGYNIHNAGDVVNLGFCDQKYLQKVSDSNLNLNEHRILNSLEPVNSRDLTTKGYVDTEITKIHQNIDLSPFLRIDGQIAMTGDLNMNDNGIKKLKSPTRDDEAVNEGYLDQVVKDSHINSSDKTNVFKYLNDLDHSSSERNIIVNSVDDWTNSPHKYNKRAYDVTLQRHSGVDSYDSKIGFNLYGAKNGKFSIVF